MTVTLLVLALNEVEGMRAVMPRVKGEWCEQILVADGGSTDGTREYADERGYEVIVQKKAGIRNAYVEALPHVRGDIVVTFSPDGNSIPELIPSLVSKVRNGYDMVIASRYAEGAMSEDDDPFTAFGNWMLTALINLLHGGRYTDSMVIFRAYRKELFEALDLLEPGGYAPEKLFFTNVSIEPLLSIRCAKRRLKVAEVPGDEPKRIGGKRKLKPFRWGGTILLQIFRELYYWR